MDASPVELEGANHLVRYDAYDERIEVRRSARVARVGCENEPLAPRCREETERSRPDGDLVWFEQHLYMQQPGYGTSYLTGKALVESLLAERASAQGDAFTMQGFLDEFFASGLIPVSLIRWELTGADGPR